MSVAVWNPFRPALADPSFEQVLHDTRRRPLRGLLPGSDEELRERLGHALDTLDRLEHRGGDPVSARLAGEVEDIVAGRLAGRHVDLEAERVFLQEAAEAMLARRPGTDEDGLLGMLEHMSPATAASHLDDWWRSYGRLVRQGRLGAAHEAVIESLHAFVTRGACEPDTAAHDALAAHALALLRGGELRGPLQAMAAYGRRVAADWSGPVAEVLLGRMASWTPADGVAGRAIERARALVAGDDPMARGYASALFDLLEAETVGPPPVVSAEQAAQAVFGPGSGPAGEVKVDAGAVRIGGVRIPRREDARPSLEFWFGFRQECLDAEPCVSL